MTDTPQTPKPIPDVERYSRQVLFPPIGQAGQDRLSQSRVAVIGCGGLGTLLAESIARAGVRELFIVDRDWVEPSNLQRQVLFDEEDARKQTPKAEAAGRKLRTINSSVQIETRVADVNPGNIMEMIEGADLVLDGLDNLETRFLLNDACLKMGIPWVYGACVASHGIVLPIIPGRTPCLRCIFDSAPPPGSVPTCDMAGVIGPIVTMTASIQVAEGLKILTGNLDAVSTSMRTFDLWTNDFHSIDVSKCKRPEPCPTCDEKRYDYLDCAWDAGMTQATSLCGRGSMQVLPPPGTESFNIEALEVRLKPLGQVSFDGFMLKFRSSEVRLTVFPDGRAIIHNTSDVAEARSLYARYVGA